MDGHRKHVRATLYTQVDTLLPHGTGLGRARNIGGGGILIETQETLPLGSDAVIRFSLPGEGHPMEVVGQVVRCEPNQWMAFSFYALREGYQQRILAYVEQPQGTESGERWEPPVRPVRRRSGRIHRCIPVILQWQDAAGNSQRDPAETKVLSRHGALLRCYFRLERGSLVRLRGPERGEVSCHVLYSAASERPGHFESAVEFFESEDYWGIPFPPQSVTLLPSRRGSVRVYGDVPLELSWETHGGARHTVAIEAREISRSGAGLVTCACAIELPRVDHLVQLRCPATSRLAAARIVWLQETEVPGQQRVGVQLMTADDFWSIPFPADSDYPEDRISKPSSASSSRH